PSTRCRPRTRARPRLRASAYRRSTRSTASSACATTSPPPTRTRAPRASPAPRRAPSRARGPSTRAWRRSGTRYVTSSPTSPPALPTVSATARYVGGQFEDDQNTLPLGGYVVLDGFVARALARWAEAFVGVENLFDQTYATGRTSEGVVSVGAPRLVHGGLRL